MLNPIIMRATMIHTLSSMLSAINSEISIPTAIQNMIKPNRRQHTKQHILRICSLDYMLKSVAILHSCIICYNVAS